MPRINLPTSLTAVSLLGASFPAYAYLDPTTGNMVVAAILGFFAATVFTIRKYFYKFTRMFRRGNNDVNPSSEPPSRESGSDKRSDPAP